jgi:dihydrofolate synthase/folylpolyglutamate synthase
MRHVLQEAGYQVGSFTSPYLERFHNRIQMNGKDIDDEHLVEAASTLKPLVDELSSTELGPPTEFEVVTALAIQYFARRSYPDLVLWEVGLGGRLDSTNVVPPILTIITNVGYDHMQLLGDRLEQIAAEKAGIIKSGVPLVTAVRDDSAYHVIKETANAKSASLYRLGHAFHIDIEEQDEEGLTFSYRSWFNQWSNLNIALKGRHQAENAAVAIMALEVLKQFYAIIWEEENLRGGLAKTHWPGRLEVVKPHPLVVLDGAHNPDGIRALTRALRDHYPNMKWTVFFAALNDKPVPEMLQALGDEQIERVILTQFNGNSRINTAEELEKTINARKWQPPYEVRVEPDWYQAYRQVIDSSEAICFTGSLYFVAEVRQALL